MNIDFRQIEELSAFGKSVELVFFNGREIWTKNKGIIGLRAYENNEWLNFKYSDIKKYQGDIHFLQYRNIGLSVLKPFQNNEFLSSEISDNNYIDRVCEITITNPTISAIGRSSFTKCNRLSSANLSTIYLVDSAAFREVSSLIFVYSPNLISVRTLSFYNCNNLTSINLSNVINIDNSAFQYCKKLSTVNLDNVVTIGMNSFADCNELISVELPSISSIGTLAFFNCKKLKKLVIPDSNPYYSMLNDNTLLLDKELTLLYWASLPNNKVVELPSSVRKIGNGVFAYSGTLESINTNNVIEFLDRAFYACNKLTNLNCDIVEKIGESCFAYTPIRSLNCPKLSSLGLSAFLHINSCTHLSCPELTSVENRTFYECSSLTELNFSDRKSESIPILKNINAFEHITADYRIKVPEALYDNWISATNWSHPSISSRIVY